MENKKKTLGEKLRDLRETYDLTQGQVASALNIDRSTYTNYELDKTRPSLEALVAIARIYNIPKGSLLPDDDDDKVNFNTLITPYGMVQSLSKEERGLIAAFRTLARADKNTVLREIAELADTNPDKKAANNKAES